MLYDSPVELDIDEHFYKIKKCIEEKEIGRVVIDSVAAYELVQPEESREFLFALAGFFKERLITCYFNYECPELLGVSQIGQDLKASAFVDNIVLLNYVEISTQLRRAITVPKARGSKPDQRTKEYVIQKGGITILDDASVTSVPAVPQLPLSSYYGVLARSPTRKSPIIEETLVAGKDLPDSQVPRAKVSDKRKAKAPRKNGRQ